MNRTQYDIVKIMQAIGISARRFATACKAEYKLMDRAYRAGTWERFVELQEGQDMMDTMGVDL